MAELTVPLDDARPLIRSALDTFLAAASSLDDLDLLAPSRAHGWSRLDCLVHVRVGLQEMLTATPAQAASQPTVDAASSWHLWDAQAQDDPVPGILWTRRTASAYSRPRGALEHLQQVTAALGPWTTSLSPGVLVFQDHTISTGDFLATWAVELTVHHLDLDLVPGMPSPDPGALALTRRTVEALRDDPLPGDLTDTEAALQGFGRSPSSVPGLPVLS